MNRLFAGLAMAINTLMADGFDAQILPLSLDVKQRIAEGNSWKPRCPVGLDDLRYLRLTHRDFLGNDKVGELIVHKDVSQNVVNIFEQLYQIGYPIKQMRLVSDFNGNDWQSIEVDNTSALNCRSVTGNKNQWSKHAYGKAIDLNPIENPYISRVGYISHKASEKYRKREHNFSRGVADKAMVLKNDKAVKIFEKYGWKWGGEWEPVKDYQHFEY